MDAKIFNRVEKKYLIQKSDYDFLLAEIKKHMEKDRYFRSEVYNIYFDTDNFDLIIQSIDRPLFKEKLRARSYGGFDKVFLEIKTKIRGAAYRDDFLEKDDFEDDHNFGFKRRILITHKDFNELMKGKTTAEKLAQRKVEENSDLQIAKEVDYIIKKFNLKPKILIYYNRESFTGENSLRITFDKNLRFRHENIRFRKNSKDKSFFKNEKNIIMEIKAKDAMPLWLVKVLSAAHIYPEQFSKVGKVYETLRKEQNV